MSETVKPQADVKLPVGDKLILSSSPHLSSGSSLAKIMSGVLLALLPQVIASTWIFGFRALFVIIYTALCCVGAEALWCKMAGKEVWRNISDCSAVVTGVLLAMCLPVSVPLYVPPIGAILASEKVASAIAIGDHGSTFGGNTLSCAVSLAAMRELIRNDYCAIAAQKGAYLTAALKAIESEKIVEVRGAGLLVGVQLADGFPAGALMKTLISKGFVCGTAAGNVLRLAPPLVISFEEMDAFLAALKEELN